MGRPIKLATAARFTKHPPLSHQLAAWNQLEDAISDETLREFAELFRSAPAPKPPPPVAQPAGSVLLRVPFFSQLDNVSGQGWRECFSSSSAMIAAYYSKIKGDDQYNVIRARYGDTTSSTAQVLALQSLGLKTDFLTNGSTSVLEGDLRAGRPVAVGWLHKGPVSAPSGGGHWSVVIGFTPTHWILNDPYGEANLIGGGYVATGGRYGAGISYSRKNWNRRWEVEGAGTGWCLRVRV